MEPLITRQQQVEPPGEHFSEEKTLLEWGVLSAEEGRVTASNTQGRAQPSSGCLARTQAATAYPRDAEPPAPAELHRRPKASFQVPMKALGPMPSLKAGTRLPCHQL